MDWNPSLLLVLVAILGSTSRTGAAAAAAAAADDDQQTATTDDQVETRGENELFQSVNSYLERVFQQQGAESESESGNNGQQPDGQQQQQQPSQHLIDFANETAGRLRLVAALRDGIEFLDKRRGGQSFEQQSEHQPAGAAHLLLLLQPLANSTAAPEQLAQTLRNILLAAQACDQASLDFLALVLQFRGPLDGARAPLSQFARFRLAECHREFRAAIAARLESAAGKLELGVFEFINGLADEIHLLDEPEAAGAGPGGQRHQSGGRIKIHDIKEDDWARAEEDQDDQDQDDDQRPVRPANLSKQYSSEQLAKLRRIAYQDELQRQSLVWALNSRFSKRSGGQLRFDLNRSRRLNELKAYLNETLRRPCERLWAKVGDLYEQYLGQRARLDAWGWPAGSLQQETTTTSSSQQRSSQLDYNLEVVRICRLMEANAQSIWDNLAVLL